MAKELAAIGVSHFLDSEVLETGDQTDDQLKVALHDADELVVLLTPTSITR